MKPSFLLPILSLAVFQMVQPLLALALPDPNGTTGGSAIGNYKFPESTDVDAILQTILQYFLGIVIVTAVFFIIKAGFTFVTAGGDAEKINTARNNIMYAAIGVVIALMAMGIVNLVIGAIK